MCFGILINISSSDEKIANVYSFILSQPGGPCSFLCHSLNMFSSSVVAEAKDVMEDEAKDEVSSDSELSLE